jgi:hypothetical protein
MAAVPDVLRNSGEIKNRIASKTANGHAGDHTKPMPTSNDLRTNPDMVAIWSPATSGSPGHLL